MVQPEVKPMAIQPEAFFQQFDDPQLVAADKAHYMHGFHMFDEHREQGSLNIAAGDGAYIYDTAGRRYLDAVGGMWCTNIGLGREEMAEAIADQVRQLAYANPSSCPNGNLLEKLCPNNRFESFL